MRGSIPPFHDVPSWRATGQPFPPYMCCQQTQNATAIIFCLFRNCVVDTANQRLGCAVVCPSVRMEQFGSYWTDFHEIWCLSSFRKSVEKIQVSLKSDKNNGYLSETFVHL
jgi:hypothetical protein